MGIFGDFKSDTLVSRRIIIDFQGIYQFCETSKFNRFIAESILSRNPSKALKITQTYEHSRRFDFYPDSMMGKSDSLLNPMIDERLIPRGE